MGKIVDIDGCEPNGEIDYVSDETDRYGKLLADALSNEDDPKASMEFIFLVIKEYLSFVLGGRSKF